MMTALIVSQIILALMVLGLAIVSVALARQIGVLHERIAPAGALAINQRLKTGDTAPALALVDIDGAATPSAQNGRSRLYFFLSPDCPLCKTLLPVIKSVGGAERDWLDIVLASDGGDAERHRAFRDREGLGDFPYILSEPLGRAFAVGKLPYAVLVDGDGKVASLGIVNSREHFESLFEAKERGVASLQEFIARRSAGGGR